MPMMFLVWKMSKYQVTLVSGYQSGLRLTKTHVHSQVTVPIAMVKWEFGKVHATETTVEGTTVELKTNGHHATYEMKISGFDLDYKTNKVYGVVLTTADGSEYGLHHVTNIWHGTKLGFNADDPYFASMIGKTVTQITYYTADGVYVLPVSVAL